MNDFPDDTTRSHDVVTLLDRGQHLLVSLSLLHLWPEQHEVYDGHKTDNLDGET